jgi:hypothetical protein
MSGYAITTWTSKKRFFEKIITIPAKASILLVYSNFASSKKI